MPTQVAKHRHTANRRWRGVLGFSFRSEDILLFPDSGFLLGGTRTKGRPKCYPQRLSKLSEFRSAAGVPPCNAYQPPSRPSALHRGHRGKLPAGFYVSHSADYPSHPAVESGLAHDKAWFDPGKTHPSLHVPPAYTLGTLRLESTRARTGHERRARQILY